MFIVKTKTLINIFLSLDLLFSKKHTIKYLKKEAVSKVFCHTLPNLCKPLRNRFLKLYHKSMLREQGETQKKKIFEFLPVYFQRLCFRIIILHYSKKPIFSINLTIYKIVLLSQFLHWLVLPEFLF